MTTPRRIELRIGRLVVDTAALGGQSPERLHALLQAALAQALSAPAPAAPGPAGLGEHIAGAVAPQVLRQLPPRTPGSGTA